jgi:uncharacterized protein
MRQYLAASIVGVSLMFAHSTANAQTVGLATSAAGTLYHTQGSVMAPILLDKGKIELRLQPFASPNIHLPIINAGKVDLGLANIYEVLLALEGQDFYKGRTNPNLRLVTITSPLRVALYVRQDSPIKSLTDLKGKRVPWGFAQQQIIMPLLMAQFDAVGLKVSDITQVPVPTVVRGADDFMAGRTDVFFFALGSAKVTEVDAKVGGVRALPLHDTPQTRESFKKNYPVAYVQMVEPRKGLAGIVEPTPVMHYDGVLVTHAGAPEDLIYNLTRTLYENAEAVAKSSPSMVAFSQKTMAKRTEPIEYHPGAVKFYKERGLWPPK